MNRLTISHIGKKYGSQWALKDVSAEMEHGVYAILGENGAGKTTLDLIIAGLLEPTEGEVLWNGERITRKRGKYYAGFGFMPQTPELYPEFTVKQFLQYMCSLKGLSGRETKQKISEILELTHLDGAESKKVGKLSGGMRQRLGIGQALINNPDLLILDEPTAGLDPKERIYFKNLISRLGSDRVILLATHILSDVEQIANKILFLRRGKVLFFETPEKMLDRIREMVYMVEIPVAKFPEVEQTLLISSMWCDQEFYHVRYLAEKEAVLEGSVSCVPQLEDLFLYALEQMKESEG